MIDEKALEKAATAFEQKGKSKGVISLGDQLKAAIEEYVITCGLDAFEWYTRDLVEAFELLHLKAHSEYQFARKANRGHDEGHCMTLYGRLSTLEDFKRCRVFRDASDFIKKIDSAKKELA